MVITLRSNKIAVQYVPFLEPISKVTMELPFHPELSILAVIFLGAS